jgi:hypothetical protein
MNSTYSKPGDTTVTLEKTANTTYQLDSTQVRYREAQFGFFSKFLRQCQWRTVHDPVIIFQLGIVVMHFVMSRETNQKIQL